MTPSAGAAAVTGVGVISPFGRGVARFYEGLLAGRSAAGPIRAFRADDLSPAVAAEVPDGVSDADRGGRFVELAAEEALASAGLEPGLVAPTRLGVALGTTLGGMQLFETWASPPPTRRGGASMQRRPAWSSSTLEFVAGRPRR